MCSKKCDTDYKEVHSKCFCRYLISNVWSILGAKNNFILSLCLKNIRSFVKFVHTETRKTIIVGWSKVSAIIWKCKRITIIPNTWLVACRKLLLGMLINFWLFEKVFIDHSQLMLVCALEQHQLHELCLAILILNGFCISLLFFYDGTIHFLDDKVV